LQLQQTSTQETSEKLYFRGFFSEMRTIIEKLLLDLEFWTFKPGPRKHLNR
jgi:hypothetical protein